MVFEVFTPQLALAFGATADILADTVAGIRTFGLLLVFTVMGQMLVAVLRLDEKPQPAANIMMVAAVVAAVWLALSTFVFGFGVAGAGIYYGLSIGLFSLAIFYFLDGKRSQFKIRAEDARPDWALYGEFFKIGLPYFLIQGGTFVFNTVANNLLGVFGGESGSLYIAAFGVINGYVIYVVMMVVTAFTYGVQAIAPINNGARLFSRMRELLRASLVTQIVVTAALTVVIWVAAYPICGFFAGDPELTQICGDATRICILACALGYTLMMMSAYFQSVESIVLATVLGLSRYVIFSVPVLYLMGSMLGVPGIRWGIVVADVLTGILCIGCAVWESARLGKLLAE